MVKIQAIFFKNRAGNKFYTDEKIEIPYGLTTIKEAGDRFFRTREWILENRNNFGFNDMIMVLPANGLDSDVIGYPMMVTPKDDSDPQYESEFSEYSDEEFEAIYGDYIARQEEDLYFI